MIEGKRVVVDVVGMYASIPANFKTTAMCNVIKRKSFPSRFFGFKIILPSLSCSNLLYLIHFPVDNKT